jgi:acyl carrier protein
MNEPCEFLIRRALAERLAVHPSAIRAELRLQDDLGVDPLDVVLVVLDVTDELRKVLSFESLAEVRTVGELVALVRRAPFEDDPFEDDLGGTHARRRNAHYA